MARDLVMVNGLPGSGKSTLGPRLANALGAAFLSKDRIKEALADAVVTGVPGLGPLAMDTAYALAGSISGMVVLDSWWFRPRDLEFGRRGLERSGATASAEIWCDVPPPVARSRYLARNRPDHIYHDLERLTAEWEHWAAQAAPLALGPVIRVDTTVPVDLPALCTEVKSALWTGPSADQ